MSAGLATGCDPRRYHADRMPHPVDDCRATRARLGGGTYWPLTTWPRISPGLNLAVWTLKYSRPPTRSAACASVRTAEPCIGLARPLVMGIRTAALWAVSEGPWKCAAVTGPDMPE